MPLTKQQNKPQPTLGPVIATVEKEKVFEQFYKENYQSFFYFALRYINNDEVCRDIVANTFEYVWMQLNVDEMQSWRGFSLSYIRNKCIDYVRHDAIHNRFVAERMRMDEKMTESDMIDREQRMEILQKLIRQLPPRTRLVLQECFINGRKYKEVAEELEISDNAVKKHVMKALKYLRENVKNLK